MHFMHSESRYGHFVVFPLDMDMVFNKKAILEKVAVKQKNMGTFSSQNKYVIVFVFCAF